MRRLALLLLSLAATAAAASAELLPWPAADPTAEEAKVEDGPEVSADLPPDICVVDKTGRAGSLRLVEDCQTLDQFETTAPTLLNWRGSSALICCPPPPPTQEELDYYADYYEDVAIASDYAYDDEDQAYDYADYDVFTPTPQQTCDWKANGTECMEISKCREEDLGSEPPVLCENKQRKVCCETPTSNEDRSNADIVSLVRPEQRGDDSYPCEDFVPDCQRWAESDPASCTDSGHGSFQFMSFACMHSCNTCGDKGCVDELVQCEEWSRFSCANHPYFMSAFCRASCGFCGFNSPRNTENQVIGGRSYTNPKDNQFYCGAGEKLEKTDPVSKIASVQDQRISFPRSKRSTDDDDDGRRFQCGTVVISDRFALTAAHCLISQGLDSLASAKTLTIRDNQDGSRASYTFRRHFSHPNFKYPSQYSDIAVIELARRIDYDYDKYGDTPACMGQQNTVLIGREATLEGYGRTETGDFSDVLLTTDVSIIGNGDCEQYLKGNTTKNLAQRAQLLRALRNGIDVQMMCTVGHYDEELGVYSGPCEGDSGGPLFINNGDSSGAKRRQTVEGIITGGLSCGKNIPSWHTRVSFHRDWIDCIMREVGNGESKDVVEEKCKEVVVKPGDSS